MSKVISEHTCKICKKIYSGYQSLWIHNKKYHSSEIIESKIPSNLTSNKSQNNNDNKKYICKKCKKNFNSRQTKWAHEKKCEKNENNLLENALTKIDLLEKKIEKLESTTSKPKTINNNSGTINNANVINNINIVAPGNENNDLSIEEIKSIFEKQITAVIRYIELTNFNKNRPNNHSFCVTNRDGKHLLAYNVDNMKIESNKKKYYYLSVLNKAIARMELILKTNKKLINKNFDKEKQKQIQESIDKLKEITNLDFNNKRLKNLYDELNLLCYNSRKTVLDTWETGDTTEPKDISNNMIELQQNKETESEDYKNIFIPMKDFIEMYSNDVLKENDLDYSSSSDDEEEISIRPQLLVKKLRAKETKEKEDIDL